MQHAFSLLSWSLDSYLQSAKQGRKRGKRWWFSFLLSLSRIEVCAHVSSCRFCIYNSNGVNNYPRNSTTWQFQDSWNGGLALMINKISENFVYVLPDCILSFTGTVQHYQLWWGVIRILNLERREIVRLFFDKTHNFRIKYQFSHADLQDSSRIQNLHHYNMYLLWVLLTCIAHNPYAGLLNRRTVTRVVVR